MHEGVATTVFELGQYLGCYWRYGEGFNVVVAGSSCPLFFKTTEEVISCMWARFEKGELT